MATQGRRGVVGGRHPRKHEARPSQVRPTLTPEQDPVGGIAEELPEMAEELPELEVVIEVPRGSFVKRGYTGRVDFISPVPCPFNYGSVPAYLGLDGDLLDAVVLGARLRRGSRVRVRPRGAVVLTDRGMSDDKLICSHRPLEPSERQAVLRFFRAYAMSKGASEPLPPPAWAERLRRLV
jgi:inorganic pyrophosphatase